MMHGGIDLAKRKGRPRLPGDRHPSGDRKRKHITADERRAMAGTIWQRIRQHAISLGADERLGSVLGRLSIHGVLNDTEVATGLYIAETVGRYRRLSGLAKGNAASPAFMRGYGRQNGGRDGKTITEVEERQHRATKAYQRIMDAIPPRWADPIMDVCVNDVEINSAMHKDVALVLRTVGTRLGFGGRQ